MAKTILNSALKSIRGGIDNWVFRKQNGQVVVMPLVVPTDPKTPAQQAVREQFRQASVYAHATLGNPAAHAAYQTAAKSRGVPVFAAMMTDYLKPPSVTAVDLTGNHGAVGDPIIVRATDDMEVFERHPFRLLEAGRELLELVQPFFESYATLRERLRNRQLELRIAHSDIVPPAFIGRLLTSLETDHPGLRCRLSPASWVTLGAQLRSGAIAVAFTARSTPEPTGFSSLDLVQLPLALLVPRCSGIRRADYFWQQSHIAEPLIVPGSVEGIARTFTCGLRQAKIRWEPRIEASSLRDALGLVASGAGVALTVNASWVARHPQVRVLPLAGFQSVQVAAFWQPPPTAAVRHVVQRAGHLRRSPHMLSSAAVAR